MPPLSIRRAGGLVLTGNPEVELTCSELSKANNPSRETPFMEVMPV